MLNRQKIGKTSARLQPEETRVISEVFQVEPEEITDVLCLGKGMTNRSFLFCCKGNWYIMRIPGKGTDYLINRKQEAAVYSVISGQDICDDIVYFNSKNGYKITKYFEHARACNPYDTNDLVKCIGKLKQFHQKRLRVEHEFDIFKQIQFYESLWGEKKSVYEDYLVTKQHIFSLRDYIECHVEEKVLTHIDAVADNFLIVSGLKEEEEVRLIDWEYAGMQDPHIDIAMFCIYSLYNRNWVDYLIDLYFEKKCLKTIRIKIYAYIAVCGMLWSNWCEYKEQLGIKFGKYSHCQYQYAKEYYQLVQEELKKSSGDMSR